MKEIEGKKFFFSLLTLQLTHSVVRPFVCYASVRLIETLTNVDNDSLVYGKISHLAITFKAVNGSERPTAQTSLSNTVSCANVWNVSAKFNIYIEFEWVAIG